MTSILISCIFGRCSLSFEHKNEKEKHRKNTWNVTETVKNKIHLRIFYCQNLTKKAWRQFFSLPPKFCSFLSSGISNLRWCPTDSFLMPLVFSVATTVNNELALPGFRLQWEQADSLPEIKLATGERAAFITTALSTSPRAPKHRHAVCMDEQM